MLFISSETTVLPFCYTPNVSDETDVKHETCINHASPPYFSMYSTCVFCFEGMIEYHGPSFSLLVFHFGFSTELQGELAQIGFRKQKQKNQKAKATIIVVRVDLQSK